MAGTWSGDLISMHRDYLQIQILGYEQQSISGFPCAKGHWLEQFRELNNPSGDKRATLSKVTRSNRCHTSRMTRRTPWLPGCSRRLSSLNSAAQSGHLPRLLTSVTSSKVLALSVLLHLHLQKKDPTFPTPTPPPNRLS